MLAGAVSFLLAVSAPLFAGGAVSSSDLPTAAAGWSSVRLEARKGPLHGRVILTAEPLEDDAVRARLLSWDAAREPCGPVIAFGTATRISLRGEASRTSLLDGLGLLQDESSHPRRRSARRFGREGLRAWRQRLRGDGSVARSEERDHALAPGPRPLVDVAGLVWLLTARRLDREGARLEVAVVSKGHAVPVDCIARETARIERHDGVIVEARRVTLGAVDDVDDEDGDAVRLLGMRGDLDAYLEVGSGMPVEIRGTMPGLGLVRARVTASAR